MAASLPKTWFSAKTGTTGAVILPRSRRLRPSPFTVEGLFRSHVLFD